MKYFMVLSICLLRCLISTFGHAAELPLVYIVHSYDHESFVWTAEVMTGIMTGFEQQGLKPGKDFEIFIDSLTVKPGIMKSEAAEEHKRFESARILNNIRERQPALVMTTDDDALTWVGLEIDDIPVVFNGVNGDPRRYLSDSKLDSLERPGHNITGVYQTLYFTQSLELLQRLVPEAKTFGLITDESLTGLATLDAFKTLEDDLPMLWKETLVSRSFSEWKTHITRWQETVDAIVLLTCTAVEDEAGTVMNPVHVVQWFAENSNLPDTSLWVYQVQAGILVSSFDSGEVQGAHSAFIAAEILNGADPGSLSIIAPPDGVPALNGTRMEKLQIELLPDLLTFFLETGRIFE